MMPRTVLMIGGSGFVGSRIAQRLAERGIAVRMPTRRRERARHLLPLPTVEVIQADVHDATTLAQLAAGCDAVVSLAGILQSRRGTPYGADFARTHVELPRKIAAASVAAGVTRIVHVSALKAAADAPSMYLRSKAAGEAAIRAAEDAGVGVTILQPSVIFGPGDSFLNLFARMAQFAPVLPLACADARFAPVFVDDVAECVLRALDDPAASGHTYELCGPRSYTLRELVAYATRLAGCARPVIGLGPALSWLQAFALEFAPGKPMSRDNLDSMKLDNVCAGCALPFGLTPTPLEAVAPGYLAHHVLRARYGAMRQKARR